MTFFTLSELTASQYAIRNGIDNTPPKSVKLNLITLIDEILMPVRLHFGKPVIVSSGYRCPILNKAIGGAITSQHQQGQAADFTVAGHSVLEVAEWIEANLDFDQVIDEYGQWIHVSFAAGHNRRQALTARRVKGKTVYRSGLG